MDLELFSRIVKGLLISEGKAVVPSLGTFRKEEMPAVFSDRGFTINPPYCRVSFGEVEQDDDSFIRLYARANGMEKTRAMKMLTGLLEEIKGRLSSDREVNLNGLGKLKLGRQDMLLFVQEEGLSIDPQLDALPTISIKSLSNGGPAEKDLEWFTHMEAKGQDGGAPAVRETKSRKMPWPVRLLLIVVILSVVFFALLYVLGRFLPDLVDPLLYTSEQLDILYTVI